MPFPEIDPIAFSLGPVVVRWYALSYLVGISLSVLYGMLLLREKSLWLRTAPPMTPTQLVDFSFWAVLGIIVGGRLGYVVLYDPARFIANPLDILNLSGGGMSFHGGLLGLSMAMILFVRRLKTSLLSALDLLGAIAPPAIFLVRIANFINAELYGRETSLPWGVVFPGTDGQPRHPSQLYEAALEGLILFLFIRYMTHVHFALRRPGMVAGLFGIGYALSRLLVEMVRLPDGHIGYLFGGWLTLGMVYTLPMLIIGLGLLVTSLVRSPAK